MRNFNNFFIDRPYLLIWTSIAIFALEWALPLQGGYQGYPELLPRLAIHAVSTSLICYFLIVKLWTQRKLATSDWVWFIPIFILNLLAIKGVIGLHGAMINIKP